MGLLAHHRRWWGVIAFAALLLPMLAQRLQPPQTVSEREARTLAPWPAMPRTLAELSPWPRAVDKYLGDHFGLRDMMVRGNALLRYALWSPTDSLVVFGRGRFLFFDGDAMMAQSMGLLRREAEIATFADFAADLHVRLRARGAGFVVAIPPNSATIMRSELPRWASATRTPTEYDLMLQALTARGVPVADLRPPLLQVGQGNPTYRRTDTHWNRLGSLLAFNATVAALERSDWAIDPARVFRDFEAAPAGDLARMLGVSADIADRDARIDLSSYDPPHGTVTAIDTRRETGGDLVETGRAGPTVLVLGDSFTRYYWQDAFTLHAGRYVWIHHELCDFVPEIVERYRPDIVVLAPTERFMFCWNLTQNTERQAAAAR
jgi:hypothetical protein